MKKTYPRVPYAMTVHDEDEIAAVVEVLRTSTQMGVKAREFESVIADEYGKRHGILVNSGSSALFLMMEALSLPPGSEVITPALTFSTTVSTMAVALAVAASRSSRCTQEHCSRMLAISHW